MTIDGFTRSSREIQKQLSSFPLGTRFRCDRGSDSYEEGKFYEVYNYGSYGLCLKPIWQSEANCKTGCSAVWELVRPKELEEFL